ncbi:MAG: hypothetical protein ACKESB_03005 [Candidatus Hodgkinia cicadicola]
MRNGKVIEQIGFTIKPEGTGEVCVNIVALKALLKAALRTFSAADLT